MGYCTKVKKYVLVPITSMLTILVVGYISNVYLTVYLPSLMELGSEAKAYIFGAIFIIYPVLIYSVLAQILFGDAGFVTKELVEKIY
mgnify:CR=1 FL=1